ncbi:hypothetical protein HK102_003980 [Quaeritorhiza haematococci]|nr:hypothetical protein HK102_003980 [Quaeritorhiza haematococci]
MRSTESFLAPKPLSSAVTLVNSQQGDGLVGLWVEWPFLIMQLSWLDEGGNDETGNQKKFNPYLSSIAILSALNSARRINFFATLLIYGVAFAVYAKTSAPSDGDETVDTKNERVRM